MLIALLMAQALTIPDNTRSHQLIQERICAGDQADVQALALELAKAGDPEGFIGLGWLEETARPASPTRAYAYYLTGAQHGSIRAQWKVGVMLDTGLGVPVDSRAAAYWLRKAAHRNLGAAWASLGLLRLQGRGVAKDRFGARRAYFNAIRHGEPHGFAGIGALYSSRSDRRRDYLRAIAWYRVAAFHGDDIAQTKLDALPGLSPEEEAWVDRRAETIRRRHPITIAWDDGPCTSPPAPR